MCYLHPQHATRSTAHSGFELSGIFMYIYSTSRKTRVLPGTLSRLHIRSMSQQRRRRHPICAIWATRNGFFRYLYMPLYSRMMCTQQLHLHILRVQHIHKHTNTRCQLLSSNRRYCTNILARTHTQTISSIVQCVNVCHPARAQSTSAR